jgi:hypothetical protein
MPGAITGFISFRFQVRIPQDIRPRLIVPEWLLTIGIRCFVIVLFS